MLIINLYRTSPFRLLLLSASLRANCSYNGSSATAGDLMHTLVLKGCPHSLAYTVLPLSGLSNICAIIYSYTTLLIIKKDNIIEPNTRHCNIVAQKICLIGCISTIFSTQLSLGDRFTTCNIFSSVLPVIV
jgi:hypothetical protein